MAIPSTPATPEQMQEESLKELDRMRMMSIQSLAMQRIRDSVVTLSRETGFRERPVEQFSQAPLYIPQYQQWSNSLGQLVGTPAPTRPSYTDWSQQYRRDNPQPMAGDRRGTGNIFADYARMTAPYAWQQSMNRAWQTKMSQYQTEYRSWQQAQRTLPV
jgi:hypothetical protein